MTCSISGPGRMSANEWIGGIASLPSYVTGEGKPYRPEMLLWVGAQGAVLGTILGKPGELLGQASDSLRATIKKPMVGPAQAPTSLRVASPELAAVLRAAHPALDIVCAPTPELDDVVQAMQDHMQQSSAPEESYLLDGCTPEAVASFFRATAALFRAKPWKAVPADQVLSVTVEKHGLHQGAVSIIGQLEQSFGFLLFANMADFEAYLDAAEAMEQDEKPAMPTFLAMSYERGADLTSSLRKEVSSHHWEVAGSHAYPWLTFIDKDMVSRSPSAEELVLVEAIASALTLLTSEKQAMAEAFDGGEPVLRTYSVETQAGALAVTLRVPHETALSERPVADDVLTALYDLEEEGAIGDADARRPLEDALVAAFVASPEGKTVSQIEAHRLLMEFAATHLSASIGTLEPWGLDEVLFELIPGKVSIAPSAAGVIIEDCRAFYAFLKRAFGLEQADECLKILGPGAEKKLEKALSNPKNFGMAKSMVTAGKDAGFDVHSKEGIEAWMRQLQTGPLPASIRLPLDGLLGAPGPGPRGKPKAQGKAAPKPGKKKR